MSTRRASGFAASALALALVTGCPQKPPQPPPEPEVEEPKEEHPIIPDEPANKAEGDVLEATIPLVDGESLELASLRGRPVLLEISASWEAGWADAHAFYEELRGEHEQLAVIVVSADPQDSGESLLELPEGVHAAWDPAGALAAKFEVATFPTMFVIDASGRISTVVNGWDEQVRASLRSAVTQAAAEATAGPTP